MNYLTARCALFDFAAEHQISAAELVSCNEFQVLARYDGRGGMLQVARLEGDRYVPDTGDARGQPTAL